MKSEPLVPADQGNHLIWLTEDDCVRVDNAGYIMDRPREGAFGVVVPLWNEDLTQKRALKLPRLLGDSLDENARTCKMLEDELENALAATESALPEGLARPSPDLKRILKGVRAYRSRTVNPVQQRPHGILVSFEKGKRPRFCAVPFLKTAQAFDSEKLEVFPPGMKQDLLRTVSTGEKWQALEFGSNDNGFETPAYCQSASASADGLLELALRPQDLGVAWYAGLPGVVCNWSEITLQEAIDAGVIGNWHPTDLAKLFAKLLAGLSTLHKKILHGDLRPANVMCLDDNSTNPERYVLIDFGSFLNATSRVEAQSAPSNNTVLASRMIKNRISVFYSPERRQPFEVEGVTTALIKASPAGHAIILGRESILSSRTSAGSDLKSEIKQLIDRVVPPQSGDPLPALKKGGVAVKGDLLRIQEKLFTIHEEKEVPKDVRADVDRILLCSERVARVFNERVAVFIDSATDNTTTVVSVSGYTIIPKLSVADDLYSFGSICLYVLISKAFSKAPPSSETVQAVTNRAFVDLMSTLDNVSYATAFWKNLELLRPDIELLLKYRNLLTATTAARIIGFDKNGMPIEPFDESDFKENSVIERSKRATDEILQNLPYAQQVYSALDNNTASFVLWMHFVICCLHRADTVPANPPQADLTEFTSIAPIPDDNGTSRKDGTDGSNAETSSALPIRPFCISRAEDPGENGAAARALGRMSVIEEVMEQSQEPGLLVDFKYLSDATFKPRSELQMNLQLNELKRQLQSPSFLARTLVRRLINFAPRG